MLAEDGYKNIVEMGAAEGSVIHTRAVLQLTSICFHKPFQLPYFNSFSSEIPDPNYRTLQSNSTENRSTSI